MGTMARMKDTAKACGVPAAAVFRGAGVMLALLLLLLVLPGMAAGENPSVEVVGNPSGEQAVAEGTASVSVYGLDDGFFTWCYAAGSIPDEVGLQEYATPVWLYRTSAGADDPDRETRLDCRIDFSWGDGMLKDAVQLRAGEDGPEVYIDNEAIRYPGEAVFHIELEGENLRAERYFTLRVLSWQDYAPITVLQQAASVSLRKEETFDEQKLLSAVIENRIEAIAHTLKRTGAEFAADPAEKAEYILVEPEDLPEGSFTVSRMDTWYGTASDWTVHAYGSFAMKAVFSFSNICCSIPVTINVSSCSIEGPRILKPGDRGKYEINDREMTEERAYTWRVDGTGVELDGEAGVVHVSAENPPYTFTLVAVPDGDEPEISMEIGVTDGVMRDYETTPYSSESGFSFQVLSDREQGFRWGKTADGIGAKREDEHSGEVLYEEFIITNLADYRENPEDAKAYYDVHPINTPGVITAQEDFLMGGHPARITLLEWGNAPRISYIGELCYVRNNTVLTVYLKSIPPRDARTEPAKVTLADMHLIARGIRYDESRTELIQDDGAFIVQCKEGLTEISAGARLNYTVKFDSPRVKGDAGKTAVSWAVVNAETGETPAEVAINEKGQLTTAREISRVLNLKVVAESLTFHTRAEASLTVVPALIRMDPEPREVLLYLTADAVATVRIVMTPEAVPPVGLDWSCGKKNFVDITPLEDGIAEIRPLTIGKGTVTVTEPGGKSTRFWVDVQMPVTSLDLSVRETVKAGGMLQVYATILPKTASNRTVEWSVNVSKETAYITPQGMLKVHKGVAPGTQIQVTCTAVGAPEPLAAVITITVE